MCKGFMDDLRCIYLPDWGITLLEHCTYQLLLLFVAICYPFTIALSKLYCHMFAINNLFHLYIHIWMMDDLGSLIIIILFHLVFHPITLFTVSYFCIIYVINMCSQGFSVKFLQRQIILVSKILPVHLFDFYT